MTALVLSPRDGMFLKDGREWASVMTGRAHSLDWPAPSTLLGALCTACGRVRQSTSDQLTKDDWLKLHKSLSLGRTLALRRCVTETLWEARHRVWPVPADALFLMNQSSNERSLRRLNPAPPTSTAPATLGRDDTDSAREQLWPALVRDKGKPSPAPRWWTEDAIVEWLANDAESRGWKSTYEGVALPRHVQVHVGIEPTTMAARDEILFAHDVIETLERQDRRTILEWAIGCELLGEDAIPAGLATLGGDRRLATITRVSDTLFDPPQAVLDAFAAEPCGLRLIAAGPALFKNGWLPDHFDPKGKEYRGKLPQIDSELILRAAIVPRAAHVSGYDMAKKRPKSTRRLVRPGSVYYLTKADGQSGFTTEEAKRLWLCQLGQDTREGFGLFIPGIWHPQGSAP